VGVAVGVGDGEGVAVVIADGEGSGDGPGEGPAVALTTGTGLVEGVTVGTDVGREGVTVAGAGTGLPVGPRADDVGDDEG
jgi:hypothetical protein